MSKTALFLLLGCCQCLWVQAQTADESVPPYPTSFDYGSNMGYFPPWEDKQLAEITVGNQLNDVEGIGVTTLRPSLPEWFLEQWGYGIRDAEFAHYQSLGVRNNTIFIGYPSAEHQDMTHYCPTEPSQLFANMYEPIWDNGENGTPVNDENYYALYVYKLVNRYGDYALTWEISNEPDFDYGGNAWKPADMPYNWWTNDPNPCEYAIKAPIQHYVRMLRISYEVIKSIRPDHLVAVGGLGYPSFLDAVIRNTDNPERGLVTSDFPLKGGAYFDVMSFHSYPHTDGSMREWNHPAGRFDYFRHSDAAMEGVLLKKKEFEDVLIKYGYGVNLPQKHFIITECNIPRRSFGEAIGSDEAQRNFIIKTLVSAQQNDIRQICVYNISDQTNYNDARNEFDLMGLFQNLSNVGVYGHVPNEIAIAFKTTSELLDGSYYDQLETDAMLLPDGVRGAAFTADSGKTIYVLWAKTGIDLSEMATQAYTFSPLLPTDSMDVMAWDYSIDPHTERIHGNTIQLSGSPVFIQTFKTPDTSIELPQDSSLLTERVPFRVYPNPFTTKASILFQIDQTREVSLNVYDASGRIVRSIYQQEILDTGVYDYDLEGDLPVGIYHVELVVDGRRKLLKALRVFE